MLVPHLVLATMFQISILMGIGFFVTILDYLMWKKVAQEQKIIICKCIESLLKPAMKSIQILSQPTIGKRSGHGNPFLMGAKLR